MELRTGIIILAAGSSSRLGQPKQLLAFNNKTLLKNAIAEALLSLECTVIIVTGASEKLVLNELDVANIEVCFNPDWESGMASSIVQGLKALLELHPDIEKCIFAVCDQPYVTNVVFEELIRKYDTTAKGIVASAYAGTFGTPVLFDKKYFNVLLGLNGQEGAKKIIHSFPDDTVLVPFEKGVIDIDTIEDYINLINS